MNCIWHSVCDRHGDHRKYCATHYQLLVACGLLRVPRRGDRVDAAPVRVRVLEHRARGNGPMALSRLSGVSKREIHSIKSGDLSTVPAWIAERLMAVPLPPTRVGTIRRMQALMRCGFTVAAISQAVGVPVKTLRHIFYQPSAIPSAANMIAVAEFFDKAPLDRPGSKLTAKYARKRDWPGVGAWIGIDIDDPEAQPDVGGRDDGLDEIEVTEIIAGRCRIPRSGLPAAEHKRRCAARREAIRRLLDAGHSGQWIADRVGCTPRTVERVRENREKDVA